MQLNDLLTNDAVLVELGRRLERHRLESNRTQAELAEEAGIGRATLQRLERGQSVQSASLIKVLRAIGALQALDSALPETLELPIAELERSQRHTRRRARRRKNAQAAAPSAQAWRWGEETGDGR